MKNWDKGGSCNTAMALRDKLACCGKALQKWNKSRKAEMKNRLKEYEDKITILSRSGSMFDFLVEIRHHLSIDELEDRHLTPEGQSELLAGPPSPEGVYCVYCDAELIPGTAGVGLGFMWTDWNGKILAAGMYFLPHFCSVTIAEAEAILAALKSCPIDTSNQFEVRTDCN
ncbi:hypothetical protein F8388_003649 [Cannabis sativa]|uniref:RNase H type-1 domain-containing protein n=1 Tax=Cannabis sativa TaxID=3483 RepID=A0A7J6E1J2_CANSA|nr:hypothetical protein F8388_003649 [Cannabis sativa]